jgi:hypothetical protein
MRQDSGFISYMIWGRIAVVCKECITLSVAWSRWALSIGLCNMSVTWGRITVVCLDGYLCYLCLFASSGVQSILCCLFFVFFVVLFKLCCHFLRIVLFLLSHSVFSNIYLQWRTHVLANNKKFLLLIRHPPCYSYIQTSPVKFLAVIEQTKKWYSGWR